MKKIVQFIAACPLFTMIVMSAVAISAVGCVGSAFGVYKWNLTMEHPMLQAVLLSERQTDNDDEATSGDASEADADAQNATQTDAVHTATDTANQASQTVADITGGVVTPSEIIPTKYRQIEPRAARSECYRDLTQIAMETEYPYVKVDKSYFDDALFIGDSRVEGLSMYSGLDNATFAYMEGLTTFDMMDEKIAEDGTKTLPELLSENTYGKIYIMLGINEAGYYTESYAATYKESLDEIRRLEPAAKIFIMGCMHVTTEYSNEQKVTNNDNIDDKNGAVAAYADGVNIFYLDVNTVLDDENGGLIKDYTWDDVHLQAQYYSLWENYLYERGLKEDAFSN